MFRKDGKRKYSAASSQTFFDGSEALETLRTILHALYFTLGP